VASMGTIAPGIARCTAPFIFSNCEADSAGLTLDLAVKSLAATGVSGVSALLFF
jgi:hypothetical protein